MKKILANVGIGLAIVALVASNLFNSVVILKTNQGGGNLSASSGAGAAVKVGVYNTTSTDVVLKDSQVTGLQTDVHGVLQVGLASTISGEDLIADVLKVEQRFSYANVVVTTTQNIKNGAGFFHAVCVNKFVTSSVYTIYDNTTATGSKIGTLSLSASDIGSPFCQTFNVAFATGLTVITSGPSTTPDLTFSYR